MSERSVLVVMGSESDLSKVAPAVELLRELGVACGVAVASAHRTPERAAALARAARDEGTGVIVAAAGLAHHLAGAMAANTTLPVVALPLVAGPLQGVDALLSAVQMPTGVPVAVVGLGAARNAALLAAQILAVSDRALADRLAAHRAALAAEVEQAGARVQAALGGGS